jgi:hypothetical protein
MNTDLEWLTRNNIWYTLYHNEGNEMKACKYCGYTVEHDTDTCHNYLLSRRSREEKKIHHFGKATNISKANITKLIAYFNKGK